MKKERSREKFLLFGSLSIILLIGFCVVFWLQVRYQFEVLGWTEYLGENERGSLITPNAGSESGAVSDPNLQIEGLQFLKDATMRQAGGQLVTFRAVAVDQSASVDEILEAVAGHWHRQGMEIEIERGALIAGESEVGVYSVRAAESIDGGAVEVVIWRMRSESAVGSSQSREVGDSRQVSVLPVLPEGMQNMEVGARGQPGYGMMFSVNGDVNSSFPILVKELRRRGWEYFQETGEAGSSRGVMVEGARSVMFRHKSAPLGCQLMVSDHPKELGQSQAFISLF